MEYVKTHVQPKDDRLQHRYGVTLLKSQTNSGSLQASATCASTVENEDFQQACTKVWQTGSWKISAYDHRMPL